MKNKYWFVPKRYGYGFCPISWEGWIVTLILIAILAASAYINNIYSPTVSLKEGLRFLLDILLISCIFTCFCKNKTKGEVKWNWGNNKKENE